MTTADPTSLLKQAHDFESTAARRGRPLTLYIAAGVVLVVVLWAIVPSLFASGSPIDGVGADRLQGPSAAHWFGTDQQGRDVFTRVVHGTRATLGGVAIATTIGLLGGLLLGVAAGSTSGWIEAAIMRVIDVILSLPSILVALCLVSAFGAGIVPVAVAIGFHAIAVFARLARSRVLEVRESEFVEAARLSSIGYWRILFTHILPNSAGPIVALIALEVANAVLAIGALGFLGYSVLPPHPEWGVVVADGRTYLAEAWWISTLPSVVLVIVVLSFSRLSRQAQLLGHV